MGNIIIKVPENIHKEYETDNLEIIRNLLKYLSNIELKSKTAENDILSGLFSDESDMIDEITESAMQNRQNPLRYEHE